MGEPKYKSKVEGKEIQYRGTGNTGDICPPVGSKIESVFGTLEVLSLDCFEVGDGKIRTHMRVLNGGEYPARCCFVHVPSRNEQEQPCEPSAPQPLVVPDVLQKA